MLDREKVKAFWDSRADGYGSVPFESLANLEHDPENLKLKIRLESQKVFGYLGSVRGRTVLDLGAGVGQWSFRFIDLGAASVTAVEYSERLAEIGRVEAARRGIQNLVFETSPAEQFRGPGAYDIVFISGLFVYLNDEQAAFLVEHLVDFCHTGTLVLLRDGTGRTVRHEINDLMSTHLETRYSALYRTRQEYLDLFGTKGLRLLRDEDMFDEGCVLNKYPETRLRIYLFSQ